MKSLNREVSSGCPFSSTIFTKEVIEHIINEGFEWRDESDSYSERRELSNYGCYKKYEDGNGFDVYIYICEDGIEVDQDYDCGGNYSTHFFPYNYSFEDAFDSMVDYVNRIKSR